MAGRNRRSGGPSPVPPRFGAPDCDGSRPAILDSAASVVPSIADGQ